MDFDILSDCAVFPNGREFRSPCVRSATGLILFRKRKVKHFQIRPEVINFAYVWKIGRPTKTSPETFPLRMREAGGKVFPEKRALWIWRFMLR